MFLKNLTITISIFLIATVFVLNAGTGLGNGKSGGKKIALNNKVGSNQIKFFSKAPGEDIEGTANGISGNFTLDPSNLEATNGSVTVEVKSMETGSGSRDAHMYSEPWLNEKGFPKITLQIKGMKNVKNVKYDASSGKATANATVFGDFTLHGITTHMEAEITLTYINESDKTKARALGDFVMVTVNFNVHLLEHKILGKAGVVGDKVAEVVNLQASFFGNVQ
ncbi:MAG: YceI family protein [Candidatus Kapabacteria bacterium]|nr:YceI family protein [Candidatus Kapabacteria bacterium]